jgi:hypothetical protein
MQFSSPEPLEHKVETIKMIKNMMEEMEEVIYFFIIINALSKIS